MKKYKVYVNGEPFEVIVEEMNGSTTVLPAPPVSSGTQQAAPKAQSPAARTKTGAEPSPQKAEEAAPPKGGNGTAVNAPMPGSVIEVKVKVGDSVNEGDVLLILEAMKMENEVTAPASGVIKTIHVQNGATVNTGDLMVVIE